jgi:hypothetical protein
MPEIAQGPRNPAAANEIELGQVTHGQKIQNRGTRGTGLA